LLSKVDFFFKPYNVKVQMGKSMKFKPEIEDEEERRKAEELDWGKFSGMLFENKEVFKSILRNLKDY
jgi:hypothetical protein